MGLCQPLHNLCWDCALLLLCCPLRISAAFCSKKFVSWFCWRFNLICNALIPCKNLWIQNYINPTAVSWFTSPTCDLIIQVIFRKYRMSHTPDKVSPNVFQVLEVLGVLVPPQNFMARAHLMLPQNLNTLSRECALVIHPHHVSQDLNIGLFAADAWPAALHPLCCCFLYCRPCHCHWHCHICTTEPSQIVISYCLQHCHR